VDAHGGGLEYYRQGFRVRGPNRGVGGFLGGGTGRTGKKKGLSRKKRFGMGSTMGGWWSSVFDKT